MMLGVLWCGWSLDSSFVMISILFELTRFCSSVSFLCIPLMLHCSIFRLFVRE